MPCTNDRRYLNEAWFQSLQTFRSFKSFTETVRSRGQVFRGKKRLGMSALDYRVTSNHIHLLVKDTGANVIAQSMQLIAATRDIAWSEPRKLGAKQIGVHTGSE